MASVLVDTNLALLLVVGATDRAYISQHKRTKQFEPEDFDLLMDELANYQDLWITSHCLSEVSNLLKQTDSSKSDRLLLGLSLLGEKLNESHIPMCQVFEGENYIRLGVADTGFLQKSKRVNCSYTVDFDLYQSISNLGRKVVNFNHIRAARLLYA